MTLLRAQYSSVSVDKAAWHRNYSINAKIIALSCKFNQYFLAASSIYHPSSISPESMAVISQYQIW